MFGFHGARNIRIVDHLPHIDLNGPRNGGDRHIVIRSLKGVFGVITDLFHKEKDPYDQPGKEGAHPEQPIAMPGKYIEEPKGNEQAENSC